MLAIAHSIFRIPGTSEHFLDPLGTEPRNLGRLPYLKTPTYKENK